MNSRQINFARSPSRGYLEATLAQNRSSISSLKLIVPFSTSNSLFPPAPAILRQISSPNASLRTKTKGSNFSPADDYALSLAWTSVSRTTLEQNLDVLWNNTAIEFKKKKQISEIRTPGSLKTRWVVVQRVTQKYIAAEKLYRSQMRSGETEEMVEDRAMQVYCDRNRTIKNGKKKPAPVIKFMEAVHYLKTQPKFSRAGGNSGSPSNVGPSIGDMCESSRSGPRSPSPTDSAERATYALSVGDDLPSGNIPMSRPAFRRPPGVKRRNIEVGTGSESAAVAQSITKVSEAICFSAQAKASAITVALELKILRAMRLSEKDYNQKLEILLRRTQQLQYSTGKDHDEDFSTMHKARGIDGLHLDGGSLRAQEDANISSLQNGDDIQLAIASEEPSSNE